MNEKDFATLMHGVKEMVAHVRGVEVPGLKVTTIPEPDVHAIREATAVTQKELAALLGVSRRTVENWEQRRTRPTGPARARLRIFQHDPQAAVKALQG